MRKYLCLVVSLLAIACPLLAAEPNPAFTAADLSRARGMLRMASEEVAKEFFDPARVSAEFRMRSEAADKAMGEARSNGEALLRIAQVFLDIGDSHTLFLPPSRMHDVKHHWDFHASGDGVYVTRVDKESEAEKKGLRLGDRVLAIDGMEPRPTDLFRLKYLLLALMPRPGMSVVVQAPGAAPRRLDIAAELIKGSRLRELNSSKGLYDLITDAENEDQRNKSRFKELPGDLLVWSLRAFEDDKIAGGLRRARGAKAVVLDLRGNPGGYVYSCQDMLRGFFADDFPAYTEHLRDKTKEFKVNGRGTFTGPLFVLIDSQSSSASEIFAKTVQMRGRGVVLGERSAGHVSTAKEHSLALGTGQKFTGFGVSITISRLVMADGTNLERTGVSPDHVIIPTHEDLYLRRDPVLARALELAGYKTTPDEAGKYFPPLN